MTTRKLLLRVQVGPDLHHGKPLRAGRTSLGWAITDHEGNELAYLYVPGILAAEVQIRQDDLAIELVRVIE